MFRLIPVLGLLAASPVFAQSGPSFDCAKAESSAEELICGDADLAKADRRVSDRYDAALSAIRAMDIGAEAAEDSLRASQRGWIKGRDDCWKADDLRRCVKDSYLTREGELVALWMLEQPAGVAFWTCDGTPANEVATFFFDTVLPSIRFERGDQIDAGSLVPSGSGSKYQGSFGRSIWIKGSEATYREPDGSSHVCVLARQE
jgi:uncharacterized protein